VITSVTRHAIPEDKRQLVGTKDQTARHTFISATKMSQESRFFSNDSRVMSR
jgi:hypothetical protein